MTDRECARQRELPLLELPPSTTFSRYAFKAMTTWGDVDDFRHFLPRILELSLRHGETDCGFDPGLIGAKLTLGLWTTWPDDERDAIEQLIRDVWARLLSSRPYGASDGDLQALPILLAAGRWLSLVIRAGLSPSPYLAHLPVRPEVDACLHLRSVFEALDPDPPDPEEAAGRAQLVEWLLDPRVREALVQSVAAHPEHIDAWQLQGALVDRQRLADRQRA